MKIKELCKEDRPREQLLARGVRTLSDAQLLAVLLGTGIRGTNVLEVAARLLGQTDGDLKALSAMGMHQWQATGGVGPARCAMLAAAFELGRRCQTGGAAVPLIHGPSDSFRLMAPLLHGLDHEECWTLLLNRRNRLLGKEKVSEGGAAETTFPLGRILRSAVERSASAIVLVHNHPSGDPHPSRADIERTAALHDAVRPLGILLLDHVITANDRYYSFSEDRIMPGLF